MKKIAKLVADTALKAAKSAGGAASEWSIHQPQEPASLKKLLK